MRKVFYLALVTLFLGVFASAQMKPHPKPAATPTLVPAKPAVDLGVIDGRTYTNETFNFQVTFPDTWLIPGYDFESYMKKQGFDLGLKAPDSLPVSSQAQINQAVKRVHILLTAYRSMPGATDNAIVRISVEDLASNPQIKDAVDYVDAIRATYGAMKLPADFKYSETQAEKLGVRQFAFLDTSTKAGKKRMYARVSGVSAIMFTISYTNNDDLKTLRHVLDEGNFAIK